MIFIRMKFNQNLSQIKFNKRKDNKYIIINNEILIAFIQKIKPVFNYDNSKFKISINYYLTS